MGNILPVIINSGNLDNTALNFRFRVLHELATIP